MVDRVVTEWINDLRRGDRDRALCLMMAPEAHATDLIGLAAFNLEIARIPDQVSEPLLGQMRLQWWRDGLDGIFSGNPPRHPLADFLSDLNGRVGLDRAKLEAYLDARQEDLDPETPLSIEMLEGYLERTAGTITGFSLHAVGLGQDEKSAQVARQATLAFGLAGMLRSLPFQAAKRRCYLPKTYLAEAGVSEDSLFALKDTPELRRVVERVARRAEHHLSDRKTLRALPVRARPLVLPVRFATAYIKSLKKAGFNPFEPAVRRQSGPGTLLGAMVANLTGRI